METLWRPEASSAPPKVRQRKGDGKLPCSFDYYRVRNPLSCEVASKFLPGHTRLLTYSPPKGSRGGGNKFCHLESALQFFGRGGDVNQSQITRRHAGTHPPQFNSFFAGKNLRGKSRLYGYEQGVAHLAEVHSKFVDCVKLVSRDSARIHRLRHAEALQFS